MSPGGSVLLAGFLLLLNAFFVGAEFAVISARRSAIEPLADEGRRGARTTLWAMENVSLMLACAQLGITVASLGLGAVAEPAVAHLLEPVFGALAVPEHLRHPIAFALALAVISYLHVVIGEMVPKNLALAAPERGALLLVPVLVALARATSPLIRVLTAATNGLLRLVAVEPKAELASAYTAEEVHSIVTESRREGLLGEEHGLLTGALALSERRARDVMVSAERLVTVRLGCTPGQVEELAGRTGFSRFPVVTDGASRVTGVRVDSDPARTAVGVGAGPVPVAAAPAGPAAPAAVGAEVIGYLHIKDLLFADDERHEQPIPDKRVRSLVTVPDTEEIEDVLAAMQRAGAHLARVVDAEGDTLGVVFLEDVLEELVGEVRDAAQRGPER